MSCKSRTKKNTHRTQENLDSGNQNQAIILLTLQAYFCTSETKNTVIGKEKLGESLITGEISSLKAYRTGQSIT